MRLSTFCGLHRDSEQFGIDLGTKCITINIELTCKKKYQHGEQPFFGFVDRLFQRYQLKRDGEQRPKFGDANNFFVALLMSNFNNEFWNLHCSPYLKMGKVTLVNIKALSLNAFLTCINASMLYFFACVNALSF